MPFKFNPITSNFDIIEDNIERSETVWLDAKYGNDATGLRNRLDRPFKTFEAAFASMNTGNRDYTLKVANGNYTINTQTGAATNSNCVIECDSPGVVVTMNARIFFTGTGSVVVKGGTWLNNVTFPFFTTSYNTLAYFLYDLEITGIGAMIYLSLTRVIENCKLTVTAGGLTASLNAYTNSTLFKNSYIRVLSGNFIGANSRFGPIIDGCKIQVDTGSLIDLVSSTSGGWIIRDSDINVFTYVHRSRGVVSIYLNLNSLKNNSNIPLIQSTTGLAVNDFVYHSFDTALLKQPLGNTVFSIENASSLQGAMGITQNVYAHQDTRPWSPTVIGVSVTVDPVTIGNTVTFNLPSPFNTAPISHTFTTTDRVTEMDALRTLVITQVTTPGTPWHEFTGGDVNNVSAFGSATVRVFEVLGLKQSMLFANNTNYFTQTGADSITRDNIQPRGTPNLCTGEFTLIEKKEAYIGSGKSYLDYIEVITPKNEFN